MNIVAVIPVKMKATRFPGKPLAKIHGVPMVGHIYARTKLAKEVDEVYVATPDQEILDYIVSVGGKGELETLPPQNAPTGVTRVLPGIEKDLGKPVDWVIMVQGDEPMIDGQTIDDLAIFVRAHPQLSVVNVIDDIREEKEYIDPNIVKIVLGLDKQGIWFFRIPSERWSKSLGTLPIKKQTGIIAFKKDFLLTFGTGEKSPVEKVESVDMFRLIERGESLPTVQSRGPLYSVDTQEDLDSVEAKMSSDSLMKLYSSKYESKN